MHNSPDHVDVLGKTGAGAVFTAYTSRGVPAEDARLSFEIRGSEGWLSLTGGHLYGFMFGNLKLTSKIPFAAADEAVVSGGVMGAAIDVGEAYVQLVFDLREGTYTQTRHLNTLFTMLVSSTL